MKIRRTEHESQATRFNHSALLNPHIRAVLSEQERAGHYAQGFALWCGDRAPQTLSALKRLHLNETARSLILLLKAHDKAHGADQPQPYEMACVKMWLRAYADDLMSALHTHIKANP